MVRLDFHNLAMPSLKPCRLIADITSRNAVKYLI